MQIDVPHKIYGDGNHFLNAEISTWLYENKLTYRLVGKSLSGNSRSNTSTYHIEDIHETDAIAFQIQFPKCKVHLYKQREAEC